jgi:hypothetical protein
MKRTAGFLVVSAVIALAGPAFAQQPKTTPIRGSIESIDGPMLMIKNRDGQMLKVKLAQNARIIGLVKASLADIKENSFVGVTSIPQAEGPAKALEVHIFPEAGRGTGEGSRPFDLVPQSTMTNAAVAQKVTAIGGETITLKYKDGEKTVLVPPDTPIVTVAPAEKSELKPGAKVTIRATIAEDGSYEASNIQVGLNGLTPPI